MMRGSSAGCSPQWTIIVARIYAKKQLTAKAKCKFQKDAQFKKVDYKVGWLDGCSSKGGKVGREEKKLKK